MTDRLQELVDAGLTSRDLTLAWLSHRVFPLRAREHKMCFYSGVRDPTQVSMEALALEEMRGWAAVVITDRIRRNWKFGLKPFSRAERAPEVGFFRCFCLEFLPTGCYLTRLVHFCSFASFRGLKISKLSLRRTWPVPSPRSRRPSSKEPPPPSRRRKLKMPPRKETRGTTPRLRLMREGRRTGAATPRSRLTSMLMSAAMAMAVGPQRALFLRPPPIPTRAPTKVRSSSVMFPVRFRRPAVSLLCLVSSSNSAAVRAWL